MGRLRASILPVLLCSCSDPLVQVSEGPAGSYEPDVAVNASMVAVAWNDDRTGNDEIWLRLFDRDLHPLTEELRLTDTPAADYEADTELLDDGVAIAWYERGRDNRYRVWLGLWEASGELRWQLPLSDPSLRGRIPVLKRMADQLFVAWVEDDTSNDISLIRSVIVDFDGQTTSTVATPGRASADTWNLNPEVLGESTLFLVWDAGYETSANELYTAVIDGDSVRTRRLTEDDGIASKYPDLAVNAETAGLAWFDELPGNSEIFVAFVPVRELGISALPLPSGRIRQVTNGPGSSIGAYMAWNGSQFGLAFNDDEIAGNHEVWFQQFDQAGNPDTSIERLTETSRDSLIPSIEGLDTGFVLGWNEVELNGHDTRVSEVLVSKQP